MIYFKLIFIYRRYKVYIVIIFHMIFPNAQQHLLKRLFFLQRIAFLLCQKSLDCTSLSHLWVNYLVLLIMCSCVRSTWSRLLQLSRKTIFNVMILPILLFLFLKIVSSSRAHALPCMFQNQHVCLQKTYGCFDRNYIKFLHQFEETGIFILLIIPVHEYFSYIIFYKIFYLVTCVICVIVH